MRKNLDLLVTAVVALAGTATVLLVDGGVVRGAGGVLLVLMLPGYSLQAALVPARGLESSARLALTLGLSIALAVLAGLVLDVTGIGFGAVEWAAALCVLTVAGCLAAALRRRRAAATVLTGPRVTVPSWKVLVPFLVAGLLAASAVVVSRESALNQERGDRFTQLSLLPVEGHPGAYFAEVSNREHRRRVYVLRAFAGSTPVGPDRTLRLDPGKTRRVKLSEPRGNLGNRFEARLSLATSPDRVYRRVFTGGLKAPRSGS